MAGQRHFLYKAEMPEDPYSTLQFTPWWYVCRDMVRSCDLEKCLQCEKLIMALRRNPQRCCQERSPPSFITIKAQSIYDQVREPNNIKWEQPTSYPRCTKRRTIKRRKDRAFTHHMMRPESNKPFPFFQLPREIRDQVYSNLVVAQSSCSRSIIPASSLLSDKKMRTAAQAKRERLNQKRLSSGKPPIRERYVESEPIVHLNLLQASQRLLTEAKDSLYSSNWFSITLTKLPTIQFESPYGWDFSRITRLQIELQLKDAGHMNSYVDWGTLFAQFSSLRFMRIIPTFHPRYYDWAYPEMMDWPSTHYVHKAFFRELLSALPNHTDIKLGSPPGPSVSNELHLQGKPLSGGLLREMCAECGLRRITPITVDWAIY